jgi:hypothetical protein
VHSRHRSVCCGPAVGDRLLAPRATVVFGAVVVIASIALRCPAQELDHREATAVPARSGSPTTTMSLQERLRLYNQQRQRRQQPTNGDYLGAPIAGPTNDSDLRGFISPEIQEIGGPSDTGAPPAVYVPTQHPDEVVAPGDGPRQASAMIPETIPRTDTAADPNLLPPPPPQPQVSTWQVVRQRGITLQNTYSRGTWLFGGNNKVGMFDISAQATFGFPLLPGVSFTPSFSTYYLDGPTQTDLPPRLYNLQAEIRSLLPLHQSFVLDLSLIPGVFSDFEQGGSDSFRLQARAIGLYILSPTSQLVFGVLYLDRFDINWLPTGGWIYAPSDDWRFELLFPRPKIATRLLQAPGFSRWGYVAGEFGGDAWAVERTTGATDRLVYRDLRLIVGFEQKYANGRMLFLEAGYAFSRTVEFESERGDFDPGSTGMLRAGVIY